VSGKGEIPPRLFRPTMATIALERTPIEVGSDIGETGKEGIWKELPGKK